MFRPQNKPHCSYSLLPPVLFAPVPFAVLGWLSTAGPFTAGEAVDAAVHP